MSQGAKHGFYTDFYSHVVFFSLNIALIPGCWKKHHHGRSRVAPVYTGGNTVGEDRTDQSSGSTGRQGAVILGLFWLEGFTSRVFTARTLRGIGGHTRILRRSPHGFSGRAHRILDFEGLTIVFFAG